MRHHCAVCDKTFVTPSKLERHLRSHDRKYGPAEKNKRHKCGICGKWFPTPSKLQKHLRSHENANSRAPPKPMTLICPLAECQAEFRTPSALYRHVHEQHGKTKPYTCTVCQRQFARKYAMTDHMRRIHERSCGSGDGPSSPKRARTNEENSIDHWEPGRADIAEQNGDEISSLDLTIRKHLKWIRDWEKVDRTVKDSYNLRLRDYDIKKIEEYIRKIFGRQRNAFKLNLSVGAILEKRKDGDETGSESTYRYFYPSANTTVLPSPVTVGSLTDLETLLDKIRNTDIEGVVLQDRPDTGYKLKMVTNVLIDVYKIRNHAIGDSQTAMASQNVAITNYLRESTSVVTFARVHNRPVTDQLCLFRALAYHKSKTMDNERDVLRFFRRWASYKHLSQNIHDFEGVHFAELSQFEKLFGVNLRIYSLVENANAHVIDEDDSQEVRDPTDPISIVCLRKSNQTETDTINLNLNFDHFSYITKLETFCKSWRCSRCDRYFAQRRNYDRHLENDACSRDTKFKYPGGGFGLKPTVFDELTREGIDIAQNRRFYPYRAVYDFECRFEAEGGQTEQKLKYLNTLIPASASVASNVPGYQAAACFLNEDPQMLVEEFLTYIYEISAHSYELLSDSYSDIIDQLDVKIGTLTDLKNEEVGKSDEPTERLRGLIKDLERLQNIHLRFKRWLKQLPVLGFNSGKFDLNLVKNYLIPHLIKTTEAAKIKPIKRGQTFMSLSLEGVNFLDITNYLSAGTSYEKWIKAFGIPQNKGIWPYEWFCTFDQLEQSQLPPKEAFFSTLKQKGITDEEYAFAQDTWNREGFGTMRDMLIWYNNLDVEPFLLAVDKMFSHFKDMGFDMFKQGAISLPGLAMLHLFSKTEVEDFFQLFDVRTKDWDETIRRNIVGGPSIIFHRMHAANMTKIRNSDVVCRSVQGFDANALYLYCTGMEMPVGLSVNYQPIVDNCREVPTEAGTVSVADTIAMINDNLTQRFGRVKSPGETELMYVFNKFHELENANPGQKLTLRHRYGGGGQMSFNKGNKPIFVDGYVPELKTIIQFHGCRWHGHACQIGLMDEAERVEKHAETTRIREFLQTTGCNIIEGYECHFKTDIRRNPTIEAYAAKLRLSGRSNTTAAELLRMVRNDRLFGVVECDIQVPWWENGLREKFAEMTPIFKNTFITRDDIGPTMKAYAEATNTMKQPRRSLIGSYIGKKILLATPLLKWYLENGLVVTRVHRALQFRGKRVFKHLADEVSRQRAAADRNPDRKVLAELFKLLGNSYYGKCLTNKSKQNDVTYTTTDEALRSIRNPRFQQADEIAESVFELAMKKREVVLDLPILVAFFVYSYAKLRMLEFFFGFLDVVLDRTNYEMIEMDTDSLYFACSHETLEDAVPPHKRNLYDKLKHQFLALDKDPHSPNYDQRTPGLFKEEWTGAGMIALNSKTYIGWKLGDDATATDVKKSTKGLNKRTNDISIDEFRRVLETTEPVHGTNYGFRLHNGKLMQYQQDKRGIGYFYPKRIVQTDHVSTAPLGI